MTKEERNKYATHFIKSLTKEGLQLVLLQFTTNTKGKVAELQQCLATFLCNTSLETNTKIQKGDTCKSTHQVNVRIISNNDLQPSQLAMQPLHPNPKFKVQQYFPYLLGQYS
jgi:hypothetical protein